MKNFIIFFINELCEWGKTFIVFFQEIIAIYKYNKLKKKNQAK